MSFIDLLRRGFRKIRIPAFALMMLIPFSVQAGTSISVGIYQNQPKIFLNEQGMPSGIFVDLLNEIAKQENWTLRYVPGTWDQCLDHLKTGTIDLLPDMALSLARVKDFDFNKTSVIDSWSSVFAGPNQKIYRLSDLSGMRVSLVSGSMQEETFRQLMTGFGYTYTMIPANSFESAFSLAGKDLADAAVANHLFGETHYREYGLTKTLIVFNPVSLHFAVRKGENADILGTIDVYLDRWIREPNSFYYRTISSYMEMPADGHGHKVHWLIIIASAVLLLLSVSLTLLLRKKNVAGSRNLFETNRQLAHEKDKFKSYIDHAPLGVFVTGPDGTYIDVNRAACEMTGYERDELIGKSIPDLIPPEEHAAALEHFGRVVSKGKASGQYTFIHRSGERRKWSVEAVRLSEERFLGFVSDITEEERNRKHIERLGKLIESSLNETYIFDVQTLKFIEINRAALEHTGYSRNEMLQMTPLDLKLDMTRAEFDERILPLKENQQKIVVFETRHYRKDRTFYDAEIHLQLIESDNESLFTAMVLDISTRKKAEAELKELKNDLEKKVEEKTRELRERIAELEHFHEITIERELRMKELSDELKALKTKK